MTTREIKNMGKAKKMKVSKSGGESDTYQPLTEQILTDKTVKISGRTKNRNRQEDDDSVNIDCLQLNRRHFSQCNFITHL